MYTQCISYTRIHTEAHTQSATGAFIVSKHFSCQPTVTYKDTYWCSSFLLTDTLQSACRECLTQGLCCLGNTCPFFPPFLLWSTVVIIDHCSPVVPVQSALSFPFIQRLTEKFGCQAFPLGLLSCVLSYSGVLASKVDLEILKHFTQPCANICFCFCFLIKKVSFLAKHYINSQLEYL